MVAIDSMKPRASALIIYTMPVFVFGVAAFAAAALFGGRPAWLAGSGVCLFWGVFVDSFFNFYEDSRVGVRNGKFVWSYSLNKDVVGSRKRVEYICAVDRYVVRKRKLIVYGRIIKVAPLRGNKTVSKVVIPLDIDKKKNDEIIKMISNVRKGGNKVG